MTDHPACRTNYVFIKQKKPTFAWICRHLQPPGTWYTGTWHRCTVWQHSDSSETLQLGLFWGRQLFWFILIQETFSSFLTLNNITIKLFHSSTIPRQQERLSVRDFYQIEVSFFWQSSAIDKIKLMQPSFLWSLSSGSRKCPRECKDHGPKVDCQASTKLYFTSQLEFFFIILGVFPKMISTLQAGISD